MAFLTFSACKKDALETSDAEQIVTVDDRQTVTERILEFKSNLNRKDNTLVLRAGPYTDAQVIWGSEATLNSTYTQVFNASNERFVASDVFEVVKSGGVITQTALDDFYNDALDFASNHFYCICPDPSNQVPVVYDVEMDSTASNFLRLKVTSVVAIKNGVHSIRTGFASGDDFSAFDISTDYCNNGQVDAHLPVTEVINHKLRTISISYFTDVVTKTHSDFWEWDDVWASDPDPTDFVNDYNAWALNCRNGNSTQCADRVCPNSNNWAGVSCLESTELNIYVTNIKDIYTSYNSSTEKYIHSDLMIEHGLCLGFDLHSWSTRAKYGTIHIVPPDYVLLPLSCP